MTRLSAPDEYLRVLLQVDSLEVTRSADDCCMPIIAPPPLTQAAPLATSLIRSVGAQHTPAQRTTTTPAQPTPIGLFAASTFVSSSGAASSLRPVAAAAVQGEQRIGRIVVRLRNKKGTLRTPQDKSRIQRDINWVNSVVSAERRRAPDVERGDALKAAILVGRHWRVSLA